jgi:hypothetical protein
METRAMPKRILLRLEIPAVLFIRLVVQCGVKREVNRGFQKIVRPKEESLRLLELHAYTASLRASDLACSVTENTSDTARNHAQQSGIAFLLACDRLSSADQLECVQLHEGLREHILLSSRTSRLGRIVNLQRIVRGS